MKMIAFIVCRLDAPDDAAFVLAPTLCIALEAATRRFNWTDLDGVTAEAFVNGQWVPAIDTELN